MAFGDTSSPTSPGSTDHSALLSTHIIPHSASEPPKPVSQSSNSVHAAAAPHSRTEPDNSTSTESPSPAPLSPVDREAFSTLRPTASPPPHETVAYTAAASARGRSLDHHGNFAPDHDPRRTSIPSPATVVKNLPDAASKTLTTTVAAPVRTLDTIKSKLQSPSTASKSKSEIPHSLSQVERDLRHNKDAPGNLDKPTKSGSFSSLLGRAKSHKSKAGSALMARGPRRADSADVAGGDEGVREEEEEEDDEVVQQRIKEQQKRLEELDEAQTVGLLRTRQEAGVEEAEEEEEAVGPTSPTKSGWLVGLPLFGNAGPSKDQHGQEGGESSSRRSSFRRSRSRRRRQPTGESDDADSRDGLRRSDSEKLSSSQPAENRGRRRSHTRSASASRAAAAAARSKSRSGTTLHPPRRQSLTWTSKLRTKIPIKEFPLQGSGLESEFNQECPLWARQPYKYIYFSYFGLSIGLYHLPRWAVSSILPSHRGRPDWSWKKATMVKLYRHGCQLTFRTRTSLGRDLGKEVPHSKTVRCKFTWVDPVGEEDVRGELRRAMEVQGVGAQRTCGFWYGDVARQGKSRKEATPTQEHGDALRESEASLGAGSQTSGDSGRSSQKEAAGGVGRPAEPGEKVLYHLHGGAYWIGTAHEKDVTAAVNTESLRYMAEIYKAREVASKAGSSSKTVPTGDAARNGDPHSGAGSSSSSSSSSTSPYANKLLRSFSLDYRLCVPGRPRAGSYPAALLDALSGYLYLVRDLGFSPSNIIVAGDSAGGNLAMALCRYLRDEGEAVAAQPGALLLMSPWVDVSRSHSGPTGAPNLDSSVHTNQDSDIISSLIAFRNTAVSAFLGDLPARETYRNPYISPVSLQLPLERGGSPPFYGFHGLPKKIYITTGSAEISYDQHLTLAHRLAAGTRRGRPVYAGDRLSVGCNASEMAERRGRPRPKEMLDEQQRGISVTPIEEMDGFGMSAVDGEAGEQKGKRRMHASPPPEPEEKEDREVVLDEVKDAVHDYLLFKWFEPERSSTWRRIAKWIDEV